MSLFSRLYFINCKLPFAGRKSITFFPIFKGGTINSRENNLFFPTNVTYAVKVCAVPANVEQNTKKQLVMKQIMR